MKINRIIWVLLLAATMALPPNSGTPVKASDVLIRWYGEYAALLREMVLHPTGPTETSQEFRRARAAQLIQQIDRMRRQLGQQTGLWIGTNVPAAYVAGLKLATRQAIDVGIVKKNSAITGSFAIVDSRAVEILARDTAADLNNAARGAADRAKTLLRQTAQHGLAERDINRIVAGGIVEGTPRETIQKLREGFEKVHGETVPITDKNGQVRNYEARDYARLVARTKTREAVVTAQHERLEEVGVDLVAIVGRVSRNFCTAFLGQVFSLSGKSDKYPAYDSLPGGGAPFHPNCSKSTRPFIDYLASKPQLDLAAGLDDARSLLGMDTSRAQRTFKDLQIFAQQQKRYPRLVQKAVGK